MTMNAEEVLAVLDKHAETLLASDYPGASEDYRATVEARAAVEQMAKDAERYSLLCQHVDASIAYARRLYLHYHAAGNEAVAEDFSRLVCALECDRAVTAVQAPAAWLASDGSGRVIDAKAKNAGKRAAAASSATAIYSIPLYAAPPAPVVAGKVIKLTPHEIQSGFDRVQYAEMLIRQLPEDHDGRNTWLMNYGQQGDAPPDPVTQELSPAFTDSARAAIEWVLYHHQGGSSPVGQPLRFALGIGSHEPLADWRVAEAKRWSEHAGATTEQFHRKPAMPAPAVTDEMVTVPREPTEAMLEAAMDREDAEPLSAWGKVKQAPHAAIYRAMLAAYEKGVRRE